MQWSITNKTVSADVEIQEKEREAREHWEGLLASMRRYPGRWHEIHDVAEATIRAWLEPQDRGSLVLELQEDPRAEGWFKVCYRETLVVPKRGGIHPELLDRMYSGS